MTERALPATIDAPTLAALLGLTANRVNALARDGAIPRAGRAFPLPEAVTAYVEWCRANPAGRHVAAPDLADEKLRLAKEQADKIALANALTREELVPVQEVRREWRSIVVDLRARLLAVSPRVAAALALDPNTAARLDAELRIALEDIADDG